VVRDDATVAALSWAGPDVIEAVAVGRSKWSDLTAAHTGQLVRMLH